MLGELLPYSDHWQVSLRKAEKESRRLGIHNIGELVVGLDDLAADITNSGGSLVKAENVFRWFGIHNIRELLVDLEDLSMDSFAGGGPLLAEARSAGPDSVEHV